MTHARLLWLALAASVLVGAATVPASAASRVTLGSARFAKDVPMFYGAGKVRPKVVGDGSTCAGQASELKWRNWGRKRATATGSICDFPEGCTSACSRKTRAEAVAYDLGRCTRGGARVYRRFKVRLVDVDDGSRSDWASLNTFGAGGRLCRGRT
jgi:hypothetical protein